MKLPHIKVEYHEEDTGAPGKMSLALILGFGLHWAWVYLFMFNGQYILFPQAASMQLLLSATSGVCHAATLLGYALFLKQSRALFDTAKHIGRNRILATGMMLVAMVLCLAGAMAPEGVAQQLCFAIAGVGSGVGSAVLLMSFGVSFSVCDLPTIAMCAALSVPVGAIVFVAILAVSNVYVAVGLLMFFLVPLGELACLNKCSITLVDHLEFAYLTMPVRTGLFAGRIGIPSVVFGVMLGVLRTCALTDTSGVFFTAEEASGNLFTSAVFTASLATCLALVVAMLALRKSRYFSFRMLVPIIAVLLALLCSDWGEDAFFRCFALFASYFMLEICLWVMYADIAQNYRVSAFTTFGFGHGLLSAGSTLAFLAIQPGGVLEQVVGNPLGIVVVGLITLPLGVAVLPNAAELRSTLIRGKFCPSLFEDINDAISLDADEQTPVLSGKAAAENMDGKADDEPEKRASDAGTTDDGAGVVAGEELVAVPESAETQEQKLGRFKRKCAAVADTFLLSRKETEVLFLLAKGRNSAAIQEALYISAGTANTHMRHIYRKLDVHSQHELIELVENMEVE